MTRQTSSTTQLLRAECQGCPWISTAANTFGTAAQHHDRTGHAVIVTVNRTIIYGDLNQPLPGQLALDEP